MLVLALQFSPHDFDQAEELVGLLADLEPKIRRDCEFMLFYRRDLQESEIERLAVRARAKFPRTLKVAAWDFADGWPHGANTMWASLMRQLFHLQREAQLVADGALTFEPDCIPITADWITQLSEAWNLALREGKEAIGHFHPTPDKATHMNGNAIFRVDFWKRHEEVTGAHGLMPWDVEHARVILPVARDTPLINQYYRMDNFALKDFKALAKSPCVLFHGVKNPEGRAIARKNLVELGHA